MMRNLFLLILVFILSFAAPGDAVKAEEMGISLIVNDNMISDLQVRDRLKLIMSSSGIPNTVENKNKLAPQILDMLVNETLKMQEATAAGIEVSEEEIKQGIARIAEQNKFSLEQFEKILATQGIPRRTLEDQIRSEIAWGKYVQAELRPQVQVSESDIDSELARLEKNPEFANKLPSRDQVLNKIGNERLSRLQAQYLRDVKADAFIESRG
jgi:peptidyl-prolyl cis-trans isomerase SurA